MADRSSNPEPRVRLTCDWIRSRGSAGSQMSFALEVGLDLSSAFFSVVLSGPTRFAMPPPCHVPPLDVPVWGFLLVSENADIPGARHGAGSLCGAITVRIGLESNCLLIIAALIASSRGERRDIAFLSASVQKASGALPNPGDVRGGEDRGGRGEDGRA